MARVALILPCLLLFASSFLSSQQLPFKSYTVQDGLVANPVRRIYQDSKGFIWIATWEGLSKYDGNKFTNFSMASGLSFNLVNDLYEDRDGKIYVAENDGSIDVIQHDRVLKNPNANKIVVNRFFKTNKEKLYVGTDGKGLFEFREGKLYPLPTHLPVSITDYVPLNDSMAIVSSGEDYLMVDEELNVLGQLSSLASDFNKVYRDSKHRVWICSPTGLKLVAPVQKRKGSIDLSPLPPPFNISLFRNQAIYNIFEDRDGNVWISTTKGLARIEPSGKIQFLSGSLGLATLTIPAIYQDREENIWIGSQQGLMKLVTKNDVRVFTTENGLQHDEVFDIVPFEDKYIGLGIGLKGQKINTADFSIKPLDASRETILSYAKKQRLFGFLSLKYFNDSLKREVLCAAADGQENIFLGTTEGIVTISHARADKITLPYRITTLVFDRQGYLWAGTWKNGLFRITPHYKQDSIQFTIDDLTSLCPENGIRSGFLDSKGNLWFGTRYNGAFRISGSDYLGYTVLPYNTSHDLTSNFVRVFDEDEKGNIWIGTYSGINKLKPSGQGYQVFNFSRISNQFRIINSIYAAPGGVVWCGGYPGLIRFRDDQLDTLAAFPVFINSVQAGKPEDSLHESTKEQLSLAHNHNMMRFEFSSPFFINEREVFYSYRLAGSNDTSWSRPSNQHAVMYASLQPGSYRFEVRALGWNGQWGTASGYSFTIRPPFWKTGWFIGACMLLVAAVLYLLYRYRINQLMKLQKVRNRIATDLHDDIGSTLTNISILTELSKNNIGDPRMAQVFIGRISEEVSSSGQALDDIVWSINTQNDSLQQVTARMRRFAAEMFDGVNIQYSLQMEEQFDALKLNMEQRRDVFLIYKEALNNIYKHARAKNVTVKLGVEKRHLHITIADDGTGFDTNLVTSRNGIKSLRERVINWKGNISIESVPGKGTTISVFLPLKNTSLK
ncbi:MAG TPA: two-component regulator propeller domain-containing protein [Chitinophagaceae bacterium]|nr:two-component regulator propeller domain-containing protein [Chitinophagaceae bacterium]